jgi:hypothetical protein
MVEFISRDDLQANVGYKVRVTGVLEDATASEAATPGSPCAGQSDNPTAEAKKSPDVSMGSQHETSVKLNVSKIKVISKGCDMNFDRNSGKSWTHILHL